MAFQLEAIRLSNIATESGNDVDIAKAHKAAQIAMMVTRKFLKLEVMLVLLCLFIKSLLLMFLMFKCQKYQIQIQGM